MTCDTPAGPRQYSATVSEHVPLARDTFRIRLECPELARAIRPGQFVMLRTGTSSDPLLARPFALYDVAPADDPHPSAIDIVYLVLGRGTATLAGRRPGEILGLWGPLGNGFGPPPSGEALFVAGGIGQTPFLALARSWLGRRGYGGSPASPGPFATAATLLYGVRNADLLAGLDDFHRAGVHVEIATDDGSAGRRGYVTDLLLERLEHGTTPARIVGCGPHPMLSALSRIVARFDVPCDLSLENHMACGFGACFSCVTPIRQPDGSIDLRRVCVEGPVFDSRVVILDTPHS